MLLMILLSVDSFLCTKHCSSLIPISSIICLLIIFKLLLGPGDLRPYNVVMKKKILFSLLRINICIWSI